MSIEMFNPDLEDALDIIDDAELLANELDLDSAEAGDILDDIDFLDCLGVNPLDLYDEV